jgi:hypothetical protein
VGEKDQAENEEKQRGRKGGMPINAADQFIHSSLSFMNTATVPPGSMSSLV